MIVTFLIIAPYKYRTLTNLLTYFTKQPALTLNGHIKTAEQRTLLYSNTVIGRLAVDGWAVTFGTAMRDLGGMRRRPVPSSLYQM